MYLDILERVASVLIPEMRGKEAAETKIYVSFCLFCLWADASSKKGAREQLREETSCNTAARLSRADHQCSSIQGFYRAASDPVTPELAILPLKMLLCPQVLTTF